MRFENPLTHAHHGGKNTGIIITIITKPAEIPIEIIPYLQNTIKIGDIHLIKSLIIQLYNLIHLLFHIYSSPFSFKSISVLCLHFVRELICDFREAQEVMMIMAPENTQDMKKGKRRSISHSLTTQVGKIPRKKEENLDIGVDLIDQIGLIDQIKGINAIMEITIIIGTKEKRNIIQVFMGKNITNHIQIQIQILFRIQIQRVLIRAQVKAICKI